MLMTYCKLQAWKTGIVAQPAKGQSLAEYALILALIAVVAIPGLTTLGQAILAKINEVEAGISG